MQLTPFVFLPFFCFLHSSLSPLLPSKYVYKSFIHPEPDFASTLALYPCHTLTLLPHRTPHRHHARLFANQRPSCLEGAPGAPHHLGTQPSSQGSVPEGPQALRELQPQVRQHRGQHGGPLRFLQELPDPGDCLSFGQARQGGQS